MHDPETENPLLEQLYRAAESDDEHEMLDRLTTRLGLADEQGLLKAKPWDAAPKLLAACKAAIAATEDDDDPANLPSEVLELLNAAVAEAE